jgi:sugar/nucleoside kinase (ribokinase family)
VLLDKLEDSAMVALALIIAYGFGADWVIQPILLGAVGQDAKAYIADLQTAGVDTSHIHFSQLPTASFSVITDSEG